MQRSTIDTASRSAGRRALVVVAAGTLLLGAAACGSDSGSGGGSTGGGSGKPATIALIDLFNDKIVSVDYNRDQGFLEGMGIPVGDPKKNGDEAKTGKYTSGKGGDYTIVCNEPGNGAEDGGRTAMEKCLSK